MKKEEEKLETVGSEPKELTAKQKHDQLVQQKAMEKNAALELAAYKKRLRESVELKRLQVEELELNIAYFAANKEWKKLQPEVEAIEAEERAKMQKEREEYEAMIKKADKAKGGSMPTPEKMKKEEKAEKIEIAKVGEPRSSTKKK
jgi:hypothetical protein